MAGLVQSENFLQRLRGSSVFLLLGDLLDRNHNCEKLYLAAFQLMLGRYVSTDVKDVKISEASLDLSTLRDVFPEAVLLVPEVLPLLLQMLRSNMKLEMSLAERLRGMPQEDGLALASQSPRCTTIEEEGPTGPWHGRTEDGC